MKSFILLTIVRRMRDLTSHCLTDSNAMSKSETLEQLLNKIAKWLIRCNYKKWKLLTQTLILRRIWWDGRQTELYSAIMLCVTIVYLDIILQTGNIVTLKDIYKLATIVKICHSHHKDSHMIMPTHAHIPSHITHQVITYHTHSRCILKIVMCIIMYWSRLCFTQLFLIKDQFKVFEELGMWSVCVL